MKQLVQDFKTGEVKVVDVPAPHAQSGTLLVRNAWSLVSAGTERSTVSTGQKSLLGKARARPDLVKKVIETARKEGVAAAIQKVQARLDNWKTLGYSTAGTVVEIGEGVTGFRVGYRVACGGQDRASHADYVSVPANLCAKIPDGVDFKHGVVFNQASMTIDAAVDGQGVALARTALASWDLLSRRLVRPFPQALEAPYAFWIVCPKSAADLPKIATFRSWLLKEAEDDARGIAELGSRARAGGGKRTARH